MTVGPLGTRAPAHDLGLEAQAAVPAAGGWDPALPRTGLLVPRGRARARPRRVLAWSISLALHAGVGVLAGIHWSRAEPGPRAIPAMSCLPGPAAREDRFEDEAPPPPEDLPETPTDATPPPDVEAADVVEEPFLELEPIAEAPEAPIPDGPPVLLPPPSAPRPAPTTPAPAREPSASPQPPASAPPPAAARAPALPSARPPAASAPSGARGPGTLRPTRLPDPPYTRALQGVRTQLTVALILRLDADGSIVGAEIERTSGHAAFDEHARTWVLAHWRFEPPGRVVRTRIPVHYRP